MAYRQLVAVSFVVLALSVGCGGDTTGSGGSSSASEQPPSSGDQPPTSSDKVPSSSDAAPKNADTPPSGADAPAGPGGSGRAIDLCKKFCDAAQDAVDNCSMDDSMMVNLMSFCPKEDACQVPANYPCVQEAVDFFDCAMKLVTNLCTGAASASTDNPLAACKDEIDALDTCAKSAGNPSSSASGGSGGSGSGSGSGTGGSNSGSCTQSGACERCLCEAGTDLTKIQACANDACAKP